MSDQALRKRKVGVFIFNEAEELDLAGPYEVFAAPLGPDREKLFEVFTVAESSETVTCTNGLRILADHTLETSPQPDILVIPGGRGVREGTTSPALLAWVREKAAKAEVTMSVCTGSFLLAKAGLLEGLEATTHYLMLDALAELSPEVRVIKDRRFTDNGRVITAAGVSAGIDAAFHVVSRLVGHETARQAARYIEYDWAMMNENESRPW